MANKGIKFSEEHKRKISENHANVSGRNNPRYIDGRSIKIKMCVVCGKILNDYRAKKCGSCAKVGNKNANEGKDNYNWNGGFSILYPRGWTKKFKSEIRKRDKFTCQLCKRKEQQGERNFDVHHLDDNKRNILPSNLITLCRSCHCKIRGLEIKEWLV